MTFLIDSIKDRFESDEDESEGYSDMNYLVGNTAGLDIGDVPGPLDRRIGRMSQLGGEIMEIEIDNPSTFQIDRLEVKNAIDRVGFDKVTLHGEKNIGFTAAYATRSGQASGYKIAHRYFTTYLEQMASFKTEVDEQEISIGYVNMHASIANLPAQKEQIASDKSVDPFGYPITQVNGRKPDDKNIYRNKDFLEKLYDFLLEQNVRPLQLYSAFASENDDFENSWVRIQEIVADEIFFDLDLIGERAGQADVIQSEGSQQKFGNIAFRVGVDEISWTEVDDEGNDKDMSIQNVLDLIKEITGGQRGSVEEAVRRLEEGLILIGDEEARQQVLSRKEELKGKIQEAVNRTWNELSFNIKRVSLEQSLNDITEGEIPQKAAKLGEVGDIDIEHEARQVFSGKGDYDGSEQPVGPELFSKLLDTGIGRGLENEMDKESEVYYNIIPAWMQTTDHEAVRFIWDAIVGRYAEQEGIDTGDYSEFEEAISEDREFRSNATAAVGAAYLWGHFTQDDEKFSADAFDTPEMPEDAKPDIEREDGSRKYTWIEWMNRFGLKVNIEAMFGDPGELTRLWRPKDISVVCHAINMTARNELEEYDENLVKFTIDLEHVASYGVDPENEFEKFIDLERVLSEEGVIDADPEKPISKILRTYHLTKPGWEQQRGHRHGPFARGDTTLYRWLYELVDAGFCRNEDEESILMFEVGGEYREEIYVMRVAMDMIQRGISPDDLDPESIPLDGDYENVEQSLQARFFGLDEAQYASEMARIEQHAFDPLQNLIQAEQFDYTYSSVGAIQEDLSPRDYPQEEYR
ncbi:MAG: hypothetical protein ABEJ03_04525 [Candidatus Nanohaloarchaea archaeon]